MSENTRTPEEEKQARMKRSIIIVLGGALALAIFYALAGGITELYQADVVR